MMKQTIIRIKRENVETARQARQAKESCIPVVQKPFNLKREMTRKGEIV